jgi:hypothetical protein
MEGAPECMVLTTMGTVRHIETDIPCSFVTGVTTSHVARKMGVAGNLTAAAIAHDAEEGAMVSALGIFDQGYYDRHGYGTLDYHIFYACDPSTLRVKKTDRPPVRISSNDAEEIHKLHMKRWIGHGGVRLGNPPLFRGEMLWKGERGFGFGFRDDAGDLTHAIMLDNQGGEHGPLQVEWFVCSEPAQFLELLGLLKSLGDQYRVVRIVEPFGFQLQDFVERPFHRRAITQGSKFASGGHAQAWTQMRICDLPGCMERTRVDCKPIRFNLELSDPIERYLTRLTRRPDWNGIGGSYVVTFGSTSSAEPGSSPDLPTLKARVGAFTRLWLGVRPAFGLSMAGGLSGPPELIERLSREYVLPKPQPDWPF